jgi:hypothetical protein
MQPVRRPSIRCSGQGRRLSFLSVQQVDRELEKEWEHDSYSDYPDLVFTENTKGYAIRIEGTTRLALHSSHTPPTYTHTHTHTHTHTQSQTHTFPALIGDSRVWKPSQHLEITRIIDPRLSSEDTVRSTLSSLCICLTPICVCVCGGGGTLFHPRVHCPLFLSALLYLVINHNLSE